MLFCNDRLCFLFPHPIIIFTCHFIQKALAVPHSYPYIDESEVPPESLAYTLVLEGESYRGEVSSEGHADYGEEDGFLMPSVMN